MEYNVVFANFNLTFGQNEEPMLERFDDIIYPALTNGEYRETYNKTTGISDRYSLIDVDIADLSEDGYVLTGKILKQTELEVLSKIQGNTLVKTNEHHPSAPYSTFYIYLSNHRMILIKNQKGSPDIRTFGATVKYLLRKYIKQENIKKIDSTIHSSKKDIDYLPYPDINIVGLPIEKDLENELEKVEKINKLTLKFHPLNGDIPELTSQLSKTISEMRTDLNCKTGNVNFNTPKSKKAIVKTVEEAHGTMSVSLNVTGTNNTKYTITDDEVAEKAIWTLPEEGLNDINEVNKKANEVPSLKITSSNHREIYRKNLFRIKKFLKGTLNDKN